MDLLSEVEMCSTIDEADEFHKQFPNIKPQNSFPRTQLTFNGVRRATSDPVSLNPVPLRPQTKDVTNQYSKSPRLSYDLPSGERQSQNIRKAYDQHSSFRRTLVPCITERRKSSNFDKSRRVSFSTEACYFEAIAAGDIEKVSIIVDEMKMELDELKSYCGRNALHISAGQGDLEMVKFLIEKGASLQAEDDNGDTPLHRACDSSRAGSHEDLIKYLVEKGARLDLVNISNELPIDMARFDGIIRSYLSQEMKRKNLDAQAIKDAERRQLMAWAREWRDSGKTSHEYLDPEMGVTLAHYVAARRYSDVFKVLMKCPNIDMDAQDWQGKTPIQIWREKKRRSIDYCGTEACNIS